MTITADIFSINSHLEALILGFHEENKSSHKITIKDASE